MNVSTISGLVGSSEHQAFADDALKDEDNAAWVMLLPLEVRAEWIERISWIRLIDRLAESELVAQGSFAFHQFHQGWQHLLYTGQVESGCPYASVLSRIQARWFQAGGHPIHGLSIQAWDRYLSAIARYHTCNLTIATLPQFETMLTDLAGAFFQILPFLPPKYWQSACEFGVLDQFYNNLRDLQEDLEQGVCYFPTEVLQRFGIQRAEILQGQAIDHPHYPGLMQFWLDEYLPQLRQRASQLIQADDLPPCWQILRDWSLQRYARIERLLRSCQFDYTRFPHYYWAVVQHDLPRMLAQVQQAQPGRVVAPSIALHSSQDRITLAA